MKTAFLFPGQGSQFPGMGKDFKESFSLARHTFEEADDVLKYPLSKVIFNGPEKELMQTRVCQLAIFVTSVAILRVVKLHHPHLAPAFTAGLSLGEYTALHAAEMLSFSETLKLVQKRAELMSRSCEKTEGTMAAIFGLSASQVEQTINKLSLDRDLFVANFNCPGQVVISGTLKGVEKGSQACLQAGAKRALKLDVQGAFHSGLMQFAEQELTPWVLESAIQKGICPLVMNVLGDSVEDSLVIKKELIAQVTHPVRWEMGIRKMDKEAVERYIEMGPGKTLAGFNKRIGVKGKAVSIETVRDLEAFA